MRGDLAMLKLLLSLGWVKEKVDARDEQVTILI